MCKDLGAESGVSICQMLFIGRPNPDKLYCSTAFYLRSKQEADDIQHKYIDVNGEAAYTRAYEPSVSPLSLLQMSQVRQQSSLIRNAVNKRGQNCPRSPTCVQADLFGCFSLSERRQL